MSLLEHSTRPGRDGRFRALYELLSALLSAGSMEGVYEAALDGLLNFTDAERAAILLFDEDGVMRFKASRGLSTEYQEAVSGHSPWSRGMRDAQPLVVPDVRLDEDLAQYREVLQREGIRALAFVPFALDAGVFGECVLYYSEPYECTDEELGFAHLIAAHVALATERERAEAARAESEHRLQAVLDNSATVIFLKDMEGRYLFVNQRFEEIVQVNRTDVVGRSDYDLFPTAVADQFRAHDRTVLEAGKALALEENAPHPDGLHSYISVKFPLKGPDGRVNAICGIATDITDRKRLEEASQRLGAIVESSDDAIISKDLNGVVTSWNRGAEHIFGYTAAEAIGKVVSILTAPDHLDEMPEILKKIRQGQRVDHYETLRRRKDGQIIDVNLTVSPIRNPAGEIVGASKIAREITDRKRIEQERASLLVREQEARRTAELLNLVAPRLAAQLDTHKLLQEVVDIATALVGAECGSFLHDVADEHSESRVMYPFREARQEAFANFEMPRNHELFSATFRGDPTMRWDDLSQDPRFGDHSPVRSCLAGSVVARSGEVLGGLFFGHSVPGMFTKAHEAVIAGIAAQAAIAMDNARLFEQAQWVQTELKRSNEELRRANQDLELFAYSASHDLQEPLRTIHLSAQMIERDSAGHLQGDSPRFLKNILNGCRRMSTLIEDLLAYTKATRYEEGQVPNVDSGTVLAGVLEGLRGAIEGAGARVTAAELPLVAIHERQLEQIFQNLIGNAIKYRGKEIPQVHISAEERDGWCIFSITDNGIGIEAQFAEQVFGLFKRLHGRDEYPGSGIGLAICQRVVEQYGGRIWLEQSSPGKGSNFCFAVPRANQAA